MCGTTGAPCPPAFAASISLDAHQKAADYTVARVRLGMIDLFLSTACC
jgi:STE24 endopeptidase